MFKQSLKDKLAELEHGVVSNNTIIQDAIARHDWRWLRVWQKVSLGVHG